MVGSLRKNLSYHRFTGIDAIRYNIAVTTVLADVLETTLGPNGSDKIIVDRGHFAVTDDVGDILETVDVDHPVLKMIVENIKTYNEEVGDGATTAVLLMSKLLNQAIRLIEERIPPAVINKGYSLASKKAQSILREIAKHISIEDERRLIEVAMTAIGGKVPEKKKLAKLVVEAILLIAEGNNVDAHNVKIVKQEGKDLSDSKIVKGFVIKRKRDHINMPKLVKNAKIALLMCPLKVNKIKTDVEIKITSPSQIEAFIKSESAIAKGIVKKIKKSGANVVFCYENIDDPILRYMAEVGVMSMMRNAYSDMKGLSRATGGKILSSIEDLSEEDLGSASYVEEKKVGINHYVYVAECKNPLSVTLLIRGGAKQVTERAEIAMRHGLKSVSAVVKDGRVVAGGGATIMELAVKLREYGRNLLGRETLVVDAFSDALEGIIRTLAQNAGINPTNVIANLRVRHKMGNKEFGLHLPFGELRDMIEMGVIDPLEVKLKSLNLASSLALLLLNVDNILWARRLKEQDFAIAERRAEKKLYRRLKEAEDEEWYKKYRLAKEQLARSTLNKPSYRKENNVSVRKADRKSKTS